MPMGSAPRPRAAYDIVRRELEQYSAELARKPEIVVANKVDLPGAEETLDAFRLEFPGDVLAISALAGEGLDGLVRVVFEKLRGLDGGNGG